MFEKLHRDLTEVASKYKLHPGILTAVWLGLLTTRTNTAYPEIHDDLPPELARATRSQTSIGWTQLYHGRWTQPWSKAINQMHPDLAIAGRQLISLIIQIIWSYILNTWSLRNQHLHHDNGGRDNNV